MAPNTPSYRLITDGEPRTPLTGWRVFSFQGAIQGNVMGVKKILAQKYAGFISLDQVIGQMAKSSGTSYQDAATALCILWRDELDSPDWHIKDRLQGISKASSVEGISATKTLIHIAEFGYPDDGLPF